MKAMTTLADAAALAGGQLIGADAEFSAVCSDTRSLRPGELFVALQGPNFDGHDHLRRAASLGAAGALVSRRIDCELPQILVDDSLTGLQCLARGWRQRFALPVLAVTGSNGKTTVKQMLAAILATQGEVLATAGNLNNHIGVPLTLLRLRGEHAYAVIEMGANHAGEIAALTAIAQPQIGIVTQAGDAHLEGFGSRDGVAHAKGELFAGLPDNGVAVINADDHYHGLWRELAAERAVLDFGLRAAAAVTAEAVSSTPAEAPVAMQFELLTPSGRAPVYLPLPGQHNVSNALAAAAAATALGLDAAQIAAGLGQVRNVGGRVQVRQCRAGAQLLDDSYNANPDSLRAGLALLQSWPGEHWLVLGAMAELGEQTEAQHAAAGRMARDTGVARLFTLGPVAAAAATEFGVGAERFEAVEALIERLAEELGPKVVLLVKGSRSARMERVVLALLLGESAHAV